MDKNYILNANFGNLVINVSNMKITCYGATGLMDFDYHLTLELTSLTTQTTIKRQMKGDIAYLYSFCKNLHLENPLNNDFFCIYKNSENCFEFHIKTDELDFLTNVVCDKKQIDDFVIELKAIFETLVEKHRLETPEQL